MPVINTSPENDESISDEELRNNLKRIGTSTLMFTVAFILSNLILHIFIASLAASFNYETQFTYNRVILPFNFHVWSLARVTIVHFISPAICLLLALFILILLIEE